VHLGRSEAYKRMGKNFLLQIDRRKNPESIINETICQTITAFNPVWPLGKSNYLQEGERRVKKGHGGLIYTWAASGGPKSKTGSLVCRLHELPTMVVGVRGCTGGPSLLTTKWEKAGCC